MPLEPKRYNEWIPGQDPTGEFLLDRNQSPYKVWVPPLAMVVLGNSQNPEVELKLPKVEADGVPVFKRMGGGGAVVLSPKCLCYGLRLQKQSNLKIHDYFRVGSGILRSVIQSEFGISLEENGISDLCFHGRKILGCSLYMPRDFVLYLASVMVEDCRDDAEAYLTHPSREPEYREGRSHSDFITSLNEALGQSHRPKEWIPAMESQIFAHLSPQLDWFPPR